MTPFVFFFSSFAEALSIVFFNPPQPLFFFSPLHPQPQSSPADAFDRFFFMPSSSSESELDDSVTDTSNESGVPLPSRSEKSVIFFFPSPVLPSPSASEPARREATPSATGERAKIGRCRMDLSCVSRSSPGPLRRCEFPS